MYMCVQLLSPAQEARLLVSSMPYWPDMLAIGAQCLTHEPAHV